jgi:Flp pilus assembly protein TadG
MELRQKVTRLCNHGKQVWRAGLVPQARRFVADCSGATAIMLGAAFPVFVLSMGIGAETGYQYMTQRKLQHAADLAAHAGATRLRAGDTLAEISAAATHVAAEGGYRPLTGTITVNTPPQSGAAQGSRQSVEVILRQTQPRYFSRLISNDPVLIDARAVARVTDTGGVACVLALAPATGGAVTVSGSTSVGLNGCDIASNSRAANALLMSGSSAALSANCVHTVGQAVVTNQLALTGCPSVREFAPVMRDPYGTVAEPIAEGPCRARNQGSPNTNTVLTPTYAHPSGVKSMRFCNGLDLKGNVTLAPGLYIIEGGDVRINSGNIDSSGITTLSGEGVTFYLTGTGRMNLAGNGVLRLDAPTSGPFSGLLVFSSRSQSGMSHRVTGASGSTIQGAVYAPASEIQMTGNSKSTGGCTQIIGNTVVFTGNSTLRSSCDNSGTSAIRTNEIITIIE